MTLKLCIFVIASLLYGAARSSGVAYTRDVHKKPRIRTGAVQHDYQKHNLYWGSNYTVGDGRNMELELDTGSDDLILNTGVYHPSSHSKVRPNDHFSITYEGINAAGQGTETIRGNIIQDTVSDGVLTIHNQTFGNATYFKYTGIRPFKEATQGYDGIIGWEGRRQSSFKPSPGSWFYNLCKQKVISECRFALALGTEMLGKQVVGKVDKSLIKGDLTYAPLHGVWITRADITLDNEIFIKNQLIIMDVGTTNMQAPPGAARKIFHKLGYQTRKILDGKNVGSKKELYFIDAYYPCNKTAPLLGLSIPAEYDLKNSPSKYISKKPKIFNLFRSEWEGSNNGNNNCTAVLAGTNFLEFQEDGHVQTYWLIGQPFFQGHYIDFHLGKGLAYGNLVNTKTGAGH